MTKVVARDAVHSRPPATGNKTTTTVQVTAGSPSAAELAQLARTDRPLADTIRHAQAAFGDLVAQGGHVTVANTTGNGMQPVVTVVPPGFDPSQPAAVQTHYHGDRTSAADPHGSGTAAMREMMRANPQQVFVLPEARANVGANSTDWGNVSDEASTTRDALNGAGITNVGTKTVSAHSAGGRALAAAIKDGHVDAQRVLLLDCLYEPAASTIRQGLKDHGDGVRDIVVARGTNELSRANDMVAAFPGRAHKVLVSPTQGDGAHDSVLRYYLGGQRLPSAGGPASADGWQPKR